jgi:hypothetical protein
MYIDQTQIWGKSGYDLVLLMTLSNDIYLWKEFIFGQNKCDYTDKKENTFFYSNYSNYLV